MALNAYLELHGETQGHIKGSSTQAGREDKIIVHAVNHTISSKRHKASGLPTGKRQHKPFVITKEVDKSTPLLYSALCNNENITEFNLQFYTPSRSGQEEQHFTVQLEDATISEIRLEMLNNKNPELMQYKEFEVISFVYRKITWTYEDGGITAEDDWQRNRK